MVPRKHPELTAGERLLMEERIVAICSVLPGVSRIFLSPDGWNCIVVHGGDVPLESSWVCSSAGKTISRDLFPTKGWNLWIQARSLCDPKETEALLLRGWTCIYGEPALLASGAARPLPSAAFVLGRVPTVSPYQELEWLIPMRLVCDLIELLALFGQIALVALHLSSWKL